jgi:hypothetical protein|eukprot:COSAG01_NODE_981_length_12355_cov_768.539246_8_plen_62_part_00
MHLQQRIQRRRTAAMVTVRRLRGASVARNELEAGRTVEQSTSEIPAHRSGSSGVHALRRIQ